MNPLGAPHNLIALKEMLDVGKEDRGQARSFPT